MNITYNNLETPSNLVTFTEIPNILKLSENVTGTKASFTFTWEGNIRQTVTADSQYYVTFLGETVTNVMDASKANNKRFYTSQDEDGTAMSFVRALRNCPSINAEFNVIHNGPVVNLVAKTIGSKWSNTDNYFSTNIPNTFLNVSGTDGAAYSICFDAKIDVDVYSGTTSNVNNYVTTLEKNWYGNSCSFDMSPVLSTFSEYGKTSPYYFRLNIIRSDGEWQSVDTVISGLTAIGYHANQSDKYKFAQGAQMLVNYRDDESLLYTYNRTIPFSLLVGSSVPGWIITYSVKDSANNEIYTGSTAVVRSGSNRIIDSSITIPSNKFENAYYVDITITGKTYRFNVIKPLKATEYYQRVMWRNEYGGISFFDFTGSRSESDSVSTETYEKNIFDYYDSEAFERKKIYSTGYKKSVKLTSHLMKNGGKWIFNSLMMSKKVWTEVNGKTYYIIPTGIEISEDSTYNDIYTAKLTYEYSDI